MGQALIINTTLHAIIWELARFFQRKINYINPPTVLLLLHQWAVAVLQVGILVQSLALDKGTDVLSPQTLS